MLHEHWDIEVSINNRETSCNIQITGIKLTAYNAVDTTLKSFHCPMQISAGVRVNIRLQLLRNRLRKNEHSAVEDI